MFHKKFHKKHFKYNFQTIETKINYFLIVNRKGKLL